MKKKDLISKACSDITISPREFLLLLMLIRRIEERKQLRRGRAVKEYVNGPLGSKGVIYE